jgi:hypothetical protein
VIGKSQTYMLLSMVPEQVRQSIVLTASFIVLHSGSTLMCFLLPSSSVLIWKSFIVFKEKVLNLLMAFLVFSDYGDFLIFMRVIYMNVHIYVKIDLIQNLCLFCSPRQIPVKS